MDAGRVVTEQAPVAAHAGPSCLVADHTALGHGVAEALRARGVAVTLCHRGVQVLDSVRQQAWDALVIGFRLVDMRGDAVAHAACAERPALSDRIVVLADVSVGRDAAEAARFVWLPEDTPPEAIAERVVALAGR